MSSTDAATPAVPGAEQALERLLALRRSLREERAAAPTPAVDRSLEMADYHVFLALGYLGYTRELFPEES